MTITIILIFFLINIYIIKKYNSMGWSIIILLLYGVLWTLYWTTKNHPDYYNYLYIFENSKSFNYVRDSNIERGFTLYFYLSNKIGFSYEISIMAISSFCFTLISSFFSKLLKPHTHIIVLILYFIFPFMLDVVQIRNFISMSLVIYALNFLLSNRKMDWLKFLVIIIISSQFHRISILFLPLVLLKFKKGYSLIKIFVTISVTISVLYLFFGSSVFSLFFLIITQIIKSERALGWIGSVDNLDVGFGFFLFSGVHLMWLMLLYQIKRKSKNNFIDIVFKINFYLTIFLPLLFFSYVFNRTYRNFYVLNYAAIFIFYNNYKKKTYKIINRIIFIALFVFVSYQQLFSQHFDDVVRIILRLK